MRRIQIHIKEVKPEMQEAIGYLAIWNYSGFSQVHIYPDGKQHIVAHYSNLRNERQYTIGAIYHDETGKYSFHS